MKIKMSINPYERIEMPNEINVVIEDDINREKYEEVIKKNKKKVQDMKESGIINVDEIFKAGLEVGMLISKLNFKVVE